MEERARVLQSFKALRTDERKDGKVPSGQYIKNIINIYTVINCVIPGCMGRFMHKHPENVFFVQCFQWKDFHLKCLTLILWHVEKNNQFLRVVRAAV